MRRNNLFRVLLALAILFANTDLSQVSAKKALCKTRFSKKSTSEYCTKFGTGAYTHMEFTPASRVVNHKSLSKNVSPDHVTVEIAVIPDQNYDKLQKKSVTCEEKRKMADKIVTVKVPTDGRWSLEMEAEEQFVRPQKDVSIMT